MIKEVLLPLDQVVLKSTWASGALSVLMTLMTMQPKSLVSKWVMTLARSLDQSLNKESVLTSMKRTSVEQAVSTWCMSNAKEMKPK
jgi:hypothetical protein